MLQQALAVACVFGGNQLHAPQHLQGAYTEIIEITYGRCHNIKTRIHDFPLYCVPGNIASRQSNSLQRTRNGL